MKKVKVKNSGIHGRGVFALQDIKKGEKIIEYEGERISKEESERRATEYEKKGCVWIFELDKDTDIDGYVHGNEARFINHSCHPNCESINEETCIGIYALRKIRKGEELTYDYGYTDKDHPCHCGSNQCPGYIQAR